MPFEPLGGFSEISNQRDNNPSRRVVGNHLSHRHPQLYMAHYIQHHHILLRVGLGESKRGDAKDWAYLFLSNNYMLRGYPERFLESSGVKKESLGSPLYKHLV